MPELDDNQKVATVDDKNFQNTYKLHDEVDMNIIQINYECLANDIRWIKTIIDERVDFVISNKDDKDNRSITQITPAPELGDGVYADFVREFKLNEIDRIMLTLCLITKLYPKLLNIFHQIDPDTNLPYFEFGGVINNISKHFFPTFQTIIFILAGQEDSGIAYYYSIVNDGSFLFKNQILQLPAIQNNETGIKQEIITISKEYINYFINGIKPRLDYGENFPAVLLKTDKTFHDLVLEESVISQLDSPMDFVKSQKSLYAKSEVSRKVSPGYVVMLYGPPGTGKSLTASVIGRELGVDVYRVHLPRVISKYIGETEKNLEMIFNRLEDKECILFFDEADALFGKRTEISDAKDRYANQEVSYLLQRIERWNGLIILATNFQQNLDVAFERRILTKVFIKPPAYPERLMLWQTLLPNSFEFEPSGLEDKLARTLDFTGASIARIIKLACIKAETLNTNKLTFEMLDPFIKTESANNKFAMYRNR